MCLSLNKSEFTPLVAECDIIVYKNEAKSVFFGLFCRPSFYSKFLYFRGKRTKRVKIKIENRSGYDDIYGIVNEGYHFYHADYINWITYNKQCIFEFVIPKGTVYYANIIGGIKAEIAAEQAIYKGIKKI